MPVLLVCYMKEKQPDGDVSSAIRNSLSASLSNGTHNGLNSLSSDSSSLQNQLVASSKLALIAPIEYEEVNNFNKSVQDIKSKYIVLKPQSSSSSNPSATITSNNTNTNGKSLVNGSSADKSNNGTATDKKGAELPTPKHILYPREKVKIGWKSTDRKWSPGAGMINVGNTCYLNSTLQALFHVPALANWLISDLAHREACEDKTGIPGGCIICAMAKTLIASQQPGGQAIKPHLVYSKLRLVCKHLILGQQEDAHEFLRYLMEAMEKAYLSRFPKSSQLDQYSKETTPINQILGGYLKTSVRCLACGHESVTFQHFEDLLLDIRKANTLEEALDLYFARERLEDMGYKCESCKKKVSATKQFSLERAPVSLCIQLKRFSIVGNKLNKHIAIRQHLNLSKYSSRKGLNEPLQYRLVSMVTHLGASQHCGHYTAIGLADQGSYYQFDDSYVRPISIQSVLNTNAYIIFYELDTSADKSFGAALSSVAESNRISMNDDNRYLHNKSNRKPDSSSDEDDEDEDDEDDGGDRRKKLIKRSKMEQTLPSMPKLETIETTNQNDKTTTNSSFKARSLSNGSSKMQHTNGKLNRAASSKDDGSNSDSSCDAPVVKNNLKHPHKSTNSTPVIVVNGNNKHTPIRLTVNRLVPYDDSEYDSGTESPPEVKTKAGPFQVTNTNTPPVVSSFMKSERPKSKTPSPARAVNNGLSNGAKLLCGRRESDSNMIVKTAASASISNKRPNEWHGNETANKLMRLNHRGYGAPVSTWSGQKSTMEKEVDEEKTEELKRQALNASDAEIDRGHKKKLGSKLVYGRDNPGYNPFQEHQNSRNSWTVQSNGNGGGPLRPYKNQIYRQNPKHKFYKFNRNSNNGNGRQFGNGFRHNYRQTK